MILQIGDGDFDQSVDAPQATVSLPAQFLTNPNDQMQDLINWTYEGLQEQSKQSDSADLQYFASRSIVAPTNDAANEVNQHILDTMFKDPKEFLSCDCIYGGEANEEHYPVEFLNSIETGGLPPRKLRICRGACSWLFEITLRILSFAKARES